MNDKDRLVKLLKDYLEFISIILLTKGHGVMSHSAFLGLTDNTSKCKSKTGDYAVVADPSN